MHALTHHHHCLRSRSMRRTSLAKKKTAEMLAQHASHHRESKSEDHDGDGDRVSPGAAGDLSPIAVAIRKAEREINGHKKSSRKFTFSGHPESDSNGAHDASSRADSLSNTTGAVPDIDEAPAPRVSSSNVRRQSGGEAQEQAGTPPVVDAAGDKHARLDSSVDLLSRMDRYSSVTGWSAVR